jgi:hypothetical protein
MLGLMGACFDSAHQLVRAGKSLDATDSGGQTDEKTRSSIVSKTWSALSNLDEMLGALYQPLLKQSKVGRGSWLRANQAGKAFMVKSRARRTTDGFHSCGPGCTQ